MEANLFGMVMLLSHLAQWIEGNPMEVWLTTGDQRHKLEKMSSLNPSNHNGAGHNIIINKNQQYQTMDGFGAALTGSSAYVILHNAKRQEIMESLFGNSGIGISYIRLPMGGSDFTAEYPYSYDMSSDDFNMTSFSINKDMTYIIPILKQALQLNPMLKIVATPWSAPAWMKTTNSMKGGAMKTGDNYEEALSKYFVKFIEAYSHQGIRIDAITIQNEPLFSTDKYPTMTMPWEQQASIIKNHLGPAFERHGLTTKIWIYDHNWDGADYPRNILRDPYAAKYVDGIAWHCYNGRHDTPDGLHNEFPNVGMYFTECSGGDWAPNFADNIVWNTRLLFIGQPRAWGKVVLMWNLALDEHRGPRVGVAGCANCRGVITTTMDNNNWRKEVEYYFIGHLSKFVKPGAKRIDSPMFGWDDLHTVAFKNTDNSVVVVVLNPANGSKSFSISIDGQSYNYNSLPSQSVATFIMH